MKSILTSRKYGVAAAILVMLCVCQTVSASYSFWDNGTGDLQYYVKYNDDSYGTYYMCNESDCARTQHYSKDVGSGSKLYVKDLYLKQWWVKTNKSGSGNICNAKLEYYIKDKTGSTDYGYNYCSELGSGNQQWGHNSMNVNVESLVSGKPGIYELNFYYKIYAGDNGCSSWLYSNDGANYNTLKFGIPGFDGQDIDFGSVIPDAEQAKLNYTFNSYGWSSCTATITGTNKAKFSFRQGQYSSDTDDRTKTISISSNVSEQFAIYFQAHDAQNYSANLHLSGTVDGRTITKDIPITATVMSGDIIVMLADTAIHLSGDNTGGKVLLNGYLKSTGCNNITSYGFKWGETSYPNDDEDNLSYYEYSHTENLGTLTADDGGTTFSKEIGGLKLGTKYYYRAFAENNGNNKFDVSKESWFKLMYNCNYPEPENDTIRVLINNTSGFNDPCNLRFESIKVAFDSLTSKYSRYYSGGKLLTNVVMNIENTGTTYTETTTTENISGGKAKYAYCILVKDFNASSPTKRLIMRGSNSKVNRATVQHLVLRNSKNITVENLMISGRETDYDDHHDNAMDIDNGKSSDDVWHNQPVGDVANADIVIRGCYITSYGFSCMHISAYDGIRVEDCDIDAEYSDEDDANSIQWGSSVKLIHSKNIKLLRNSFRGSHSTSTWIQGCNNVLMMNNVYWNKNTVSDNVAFLRLVCQTNATLAETVSNVGMYYNTFFLQNASNSNPVDFLRLGSWYNGDGKQSSLGASAVNSYDHNTIDFKYNNCYSYDGDVPGRNPDEAGKYPFLTEDKLALFCDHIDFNNFWSKYDVANSYNPSKFALSPCASTITKFINVEKAVCETESSDPNSLVMKTDALNLGGSVVDDASNQGAASIYADRLHTEARPHTSSTGGGKSSAIGGGTITLSVNRNVTHAAKDIDLTAFGLTANSSVTCALSGANKDEFVISHDGFTVNASGELSTKVVTVTFNRPASTGNYYAVLTFSSAGEDGPRTISISLNGVYNSDTPVTGGWTLGAYQMSHGDKVNTIVWNGGVSGHESDWDNRGNWVKLDGSPVTCVDLLDVDLKVIIPAPESKKYPMPKSGAITHYPEIPTKFNRYPAEYKDEIVNAGQNIDGVTPILYASAIEMQAGSAVRGAEHLFSDGVRRYDKATNTYMLPRKKWLLVGTVIRPFSNSAETEVRNVISGDFYMDTMPQVYMHESKVSSGSPSWDVSFSSLSKEVEPTKVFAVYVPDQYGQYKLSAENYYKYVSNSFDPSDADVTKSKTFTGWFQNEAALPVYSGLDATNGSFVSNTYPANLNYSRLKAANSSATIKVYNSSIWNFVDPTSETEIVSQSGFFVKDVTSLTLNSSMYDDTDTEYRAADSDIPYITILTQNESTGGASLTTIKYDELKTDTYIVGTDAEALFITTSGYDHVPDMYAMRYANKLSTLFIPTLEEAIPLGIKIRQKMKVKFSKYNASMFESAFLTDVVAGTVTDLLADSYTVTLEKGEYEDRFFLNLKESDNIPTVIREDEADAENDIIISCSDKRVVVSATPGVTLKNVNVTDMAGRTFSVNPKSAHYSEFNVNGASGVYIINAVGDNMNKTEKVIIK